VNVAGAAFTVMVALTAQPVDNVLVIKAMPVPMQLTTPGAVMAATLVLPLVHVPPDVLLSDNAEPAQPFNVPVIGEGSALIVTD